MLNNFDLPRISHLFESENMLFQQDGAPFILQEKFEKNSTLPSQAVECSSRIPDLSTLDSVYQNTIDCIPLMKHLIVDAFTRFNENLCSNIIKCLHGRLADFIANQDDHFENRRKVCYVHVRKFYCA